MEQVIKESLGAKSLKSVGGGGGCINTGTSYVTDTGRTVFVKQNSKKEAKRMFIGEEASLNAIIATGTVIAPKPIKLIESVPGGGSALIMENLELRSLCDDAALGERLARMHMYNWKVIDGEIEGVDKSEGVSRFGFDIVTCCGYLPQSNRWRDDWPTFYCDKIDEQMSMLKGQDQKADSLWSQLKPKVPSMFEGLTIRPSLLHGDLWSGNAGQTPDGVAIFDPASFYRHHEYDLGIASMFGGFGKKFYDAYFRVIPKQPGFDERLKLYELFHYLNHWNHFGGGYRSSSLRIMEDLVR